MVRKPTYEELQEKVKNTEQELKTCRHTESDLRRSQYYLDRITSGMYESLVVIDRNFLIKDVNDRFLLKYGLTREEAVGHPCYKITHGLDRRCSGSEHPCPTSEVLETGKPTRIEHVHLDHDGREMIIEVYAFPLFGEDGKVEEVVEVQHDVTDQKRAEKERVLREKLDAVLETAGAVCHELNQPLQVVFAYSEHLQRVLPKDDPRRKEIDKIMEQASRIAEITNKLQAITAYETKDYAQGKKIIDIDKASRMKR